jgi:hypothetical protein
MRHAALGVQTFLNVIWKLKMAVWMKHAASVATI